MTASFQPTPISPENAELLLINPDFSKNELGAASMPENHLGLNRIASSLASRGHSCQVLDTTGRESSTGGAEELGDWLTEHAPRTRVIGFHVNSWNINHILRTLTRANASLRDKPLLFGGPLANAEPRALIELFKKQGCSCIGVVQGFGEKITEVILNTNKLSEVEGLWTFEDGQMKEGHSVTLSPEEFERLPFLSLEHHTFYQNYYKPVLEAGVLSDHTLETIFASQGLEVNRGCPFQCTYCSVPQYKERLLTYSPLRVADELEYLAREAGFFMFTFTNSNILFFEKKWLREFCDEILKRGMDRYLTWTAYHHPSLLATLEAEDFERVKRAGSDTIVMGVQSFDEAVCKLFRRPLNTKALTQQIHAKTRAAGQRLAVDYITGVPNENLDRVEEAFRYFMENEIECRNYQLKFYPATKLPMMNLDLSGHDLVPITGNLAPELEAYAVVPKHPNPRAAQLDTMIREHNARLVKERPVRLGSYIIENPAQARELLEITIPNDPLIPNKVKRAMRIALREMLNPSTKDANGGDEPLDPKKLMKTVVMAGPDSPPIVLAMQKKLREQLGAEKFEKLRKQYII